MNAYRVTYRDGSAVLVDASDHVEAQKKANAIVEDGSGRAMVIDNLTTGESKAV